MEADWNARNVAPNARRYDWTDHVELYASRHNQNKHGTIRAKPIGAVAGNPPYVELVTRDLASSSSTRKSGYHLTSNKKTCPADFIIRLQVPRTARAEATSIVRETRAKVGDLKGRPSHVTVRLRVLVQKLASVSSHWRRAM